MVGATRVPRDRMETLMTIIGLSIQQFCLYVCLPVAVLLLAMVMWIRARAGKDDAVPLERLLKRFRKGLEAKKKYQQGSTSKPWTFRDRQYVYEWEGMHIQCAEAKKGHTLVIECDDESRLRLGFLDGELDSLYLGKGMDAQSKQRGVRAYRNQAYDLLAAILQSIPLKVPPKPQHAFEAANAHLAQTMPPGKPINYGRGDEYMPGKKKT